MAKIGDDIWIPMCSPREINREKFGIWIPMVSQEPPNDSGTKKGKILLSQNDLAQAARQARLSPPDRGEGVWIPMAQLNKIAQQVPDKVDPSEGIHIDIIRQEESFQGKSKATQTGGIWIPYDKLPSVSVFKKGKA